MAAAARTDNLRHVVAPAPLRTLADFTAARDEGGFIVHVIDDLGEVFEIKASRESVELMVRDLDGLLASMPS